MTTTPTTHPPSETPKHVGMDQLCFLIQMVKSHLGEVGLLFPEQSMQFWHILRKRCPDLVEAINAGFVGEWQTMTFTREQRSPTIVYGDLLTALDELSPPPEKGDECR